MPPELWREATKAARKLGIYRVSRALRLNYEVLKRRVGPAGSHRGGDQRVERNEPLTPRRPGFVEVSGFAQLSAAAASDETVVEVVACDGARLTIRGKGSHSDVAALIRAFRGQS